MIKTEVLTELKFCLRNKLYCHYTVTFRRNHAVFPSSTFPANTICGSFTSRLNVRFNNKCRITTPSKLAFFNATTLKSLISRMKLEICFESTRLTSRAHNFVRQFYAMPSTIFVNVNNVRPFCGFSKLISA